MIPDIYNIIFEYADMIYKAYLIDLQILILQQQKRQIVIKHKATKMFNIIKKEKECFILRDDWTYELYDMLRNKNIYVAIKDFKITTMLDVFDDIFAGLQGQSLLSVIEREHKQHNMPRDFLKYHNPSDALDQHILKYHKIFRKSYASNVRHIVLNYFHIRFA